MSKRNKAALAENAFVAVAYLYVVVKTVLTWSAIKDSGANPYLFVFLDLAATWPYAKGVARLVRAAAHRNVNAVLSWATVVAVALATPYLYLFVAGESVPAYVWAVLGIGALTGTVTTVRSVVIAFRSGPAEALEALEESFDIDPDTDDEPVGEPEPA